MFKLLSKWLHNDSGEAYVGEAVKICVAVVLGAALLTGLVLINNQTIMPRLEGRIRELLFVTTARLDSRKSDFLTKSAFDMFSDDEDRASKAVYMLTIEAGLVDVVSDEYTEEGRQFFDVTLENNKRAEFGSDLSGWNALSAAEQEQWEHEQLRNYAVNKGVNMNMTQYQWYKKIYPEVLYADVGVGSGCSEADWEAFRSDFEKEGIRLPQKQWAGVEEAEAWMQTGDGIAFMEYLTDEVTS